MERVVAAVVLGGALQHGMMREDVLAVDGLAVAGLGVHAVDGHAVADHRERVAGEVQVRHGLDDHLGRLGNQVHQRVGLVGVQLGEVDALHRLQHEVLGVGIVLLHVVEDDLLVAVRADAGLFDPLLEELLAQLGVGLENLSHEVFQVKHFDAVVAQSLRERVMLLLGDLQERDVVEQQLFERVRRQVQKLFSFTPDMCNPPSSFTSVPQGTDLRQVAVRSFMPFGALAPPCSNPIVKKRCKRGLPANKEGLPSGSGSINLY